MHEYLLPTHLLLVLVVPTGNYLGEMKEGYMLRRATEKRRY